MFRNRRILRRLHDIIESNMEISGYQVTIVYDMGSAGGEGVRTVTMQFDSLEAAQTEADNYRIGDYGYIDGINARIHDVTVTTTFVDNLPGYTE